MNIYSSVIYGNKPNVYQLVNKYTDCGISLNRIVFNNKKEQNTNTFYDMLLLLLLSRFSCVRLSATPETAAHQAPPSPGFSRQEHWSGLHLLLQTFYDMNVLQKHHGKSKKPDKKTTHCMIPFIWNSRTAKSRETENRLVLACSWSGNRNCKIL